MYNLAAIFQVKFEIRCTNYVTSPRRDTGSCGEILMRSKKKDVDNFLNFVDKIIYLKKNPPMKGTI